MKNIALKKEEKRNKTKLSLITLYFFTVTFLLSKTINTVGVNQITNVQNDILLYPNPAVNEVNVVYDDASDIRNIVVYSIIGKVMAVYKVNGNSANMNLENIPSGIYFMRLYNGSGNVVATKKFTKQ